MNTKDVEQLSAYLDDELTADERLQLEQRLQTDRQLQLELEELRQTVAFIRQMPLLKAPRNYTLNPAEFQRRKRPFIYQLRPVLAVAAALVMVFGAVFFFLSLQQSRETDSQTGEIAVAPTTRLEKSSVPSPMAQSTEVAFAAPTATPLPTMLPPQVADEMNREADDEAEAESGVLLEEAESVGEAAASEFTPSTTSPLPAPGAVEPTIDPLSIPSGGGDVGQETPLDDTYDYAAESAAALAPQQGQFSDLMQQIERFIQQLIQFIRQLL